MDDVSEKIGKSLNCIKSILELVQTTHIDNISEELVASCAASILGQCRFDILIMLEILLESECQRTNPSIMANLSINSEKNSDFTRNPMAPEVVDAAVELNILNQEERDIMLDQDAWRLPGENGMGLTARVKKFVHTIERILSKYAVTSKNTDSTRRIKASPTHSIVALPDSNISIEQLRISLENTFKGSLEDEKHGTLGKIYIFRTEGIPERFAVKTIDPTRINKSSEDMFYRFLHEISHWTRYRHNPLILAPFFTKFIHGWPYVAMPYCENTLRDYINGSVLKQSKAEPIALMIQSIAALEYASGHGLIAHQDLKPENILLQDLSERFCLPKDYPFRWQARLADFGMANAYRELGIPHGSRPYLAPEQYEKDVGQDFSRVDVFACGVMLHELLTGKHPIGEVTSDVWPELKPDKPKAWEHENIWKKWVRLPQKFSSTTKSELGNFRDIINHTLKVDPSARPSISDLKGILLNELKKMDTFIYENLVIRLLGFNFTSLYSTAVDNDDARYQKEQFKLLTQAN